MIIISFAFDKMQYWRPIEFERAAFARIANQILKEPKANIQLTNDALIRLELKVNYGGQPTCLSIFDLRMEWLLGAILNPTQLMLINKPIKAYLIENYSYK